MTSGETRAPQNGDEEQKGSGLSRWSRLASVLRSSRSGRRNQRGDKPRVSHIVFFDFDRTLTVWHVFKCLAGWVDEEICVTVPSLGAVAKPHALTERGQLRRLCDLGPAWIEQAFGGIPRIQVLRQLLKGLAAKPGVCVMLLTRGYIGVVRQCLREVGMLEFFHKVYGNVGAAYDEQTEYDKIWADAPLPAGAEAMLGALEDGEWEAKFQIVYRHQKAAGLTARQTVFVDDDDEECGSVNHFARTVHVTGNAGLAYKHVQELMSLVGCRQDPWAERCLHHWHVLRDPLDSKPFAIVIFNRKHLPVRVNRHLACLEEEFRQCPNALRRIKLLMRSPLLLYSVVQHEFVQFLKNSGDVDSFSLRDIRPAIEGMRKRLGVTDKMHQQHTPTALWSNNSFPDFARQWSPADSECSTKAFNWETSRGLLRQETPSRQLFRQDSTSSQNSACSRTSLTFQRTNSGRRGSLCQYQVPISRGDSKLPQKRLSSMVKFFQKSLLGLCPIPLSTAGKRRNMLCCHIADGMPPEQSVWSRYQKEEKLGAGHFGEVFLARETCRDRRVAVKVLERLEHREIDETGETRDDDEVSVLRALAHPNLLRVFETVKSHEEVYIITEFAAGGTLSEYSRQKPQGPWIPGVMQQIVSVVAYCHRQFVLHGDLKPENVLISGDRPDGSPLCIVCDFGHTAMCIGSERVAAPGDPRYIAPEVILEEELSPKSDIYMLGVTAFELLTGGWLPFFCAKAVTLYMAYYNLKLGEVRNRILSPKGLDAKENWPDRDRLAKAASDNVQEVVRSMLSRGAQDRPTAAEVQSSTWLQEAHKPCKSAYDKMLLADASNGWGLWVPQHPQFEERLVHRAARSWTCRYTIGLLGAGLEPDRVFGARLLFRRMDEHGDGRIDRKLFCKAAERVGLDEEVARNLFFAGDIHQQGFVDFRNIVMLFLDLDSFSEEELLQELRSFLSRAAGPRAEGSVASPTIRVSALYDTLSQRPDARTQKWLKDVEALLRPGEQEITPELLAKLLRDDPVECVSPKRPQRQSPKKPKR